MMNNPNMNGQQYQDGINGDFTSLPCEAFSMPSQMNSNSISNTDEFTHKNPMYQSAHVQIKSRAIMNDEETYLVDNSDEGIFQTGKNLISISCFMVFVKFLLNLIIFTLIFYFYVFIFQLLHHHLLLFFPLRCFGSSLSIDLSKKNYVRHEKIIKVERCSIVRNR